MQTLRPALWPGSKSQPSVLFLIIFKDFKFTHIMTLCMIRVISEFIVAAACQDVRPPWITHVLTVYACCCRCYWSFHGHFRREAEQLFQGLELSYQKALQAHLRSGDSVMSLPASDRSSSSSQESLKWDTLLLSDWFVHWLGKVRKVLFQSFTARSVRSWQCLIWIKVHL